MDNDQRASKEAKKAEGVQSNKGGKCEGSPGKGESGFSSDDSNFN